MHRYLWIESLKLVDCLQTYWKLNSFEIERLCLFSQVLCDPICIFSISLFAVFKALAMHHVTHWLSVFFILMIAFFLARNFGRGTQELPLNGSYPTV